MNVLMLMSLLAFGESPDPVDDIWAQVSHVESLVHETVKTGDSRFGLSATNPARGYYIPGKGVVLVVPLRYRSLHSWKGAQPEEDEQPARPIGEEVTLTPKDLQQRIAQWQEQQKAYEVTRDADFQKIVNAVKASLPDLARELTGMQPGEALMVAVEEAPPAYFYANFSLKKNPSRRVVTFTVSGDLFQLVRADKVARPDDWLARVQAVTTRRALAAAP